MYTNSVQAYQQQYHHLVSASLTGEQAEAIMHVIEERRVQALGDLATKRDLDDVRVTLKSDIDKVHTELKRDMAELRTELKHDIANVRTELKHDIAMLDKKFSHRLSLVFIAVLASPYLPDIIRFITTLMK